MFGRGPGLRSPPGRRADAHRLRRRPMTVDRARRGCWSAGLDRGRRLLVCPSRARTPHRQSVASERTVPARRPRGRTSSGPMRPTAHRGAWRRPFRRMARGCTPARPARREPIGRRWRTLRRARERRASIRAARGTAPPGRSGLRDGGGPNRRRRGEGVGLAHEARDPRSVGDPRGQAVWLGKLSACSGVTRSRARESGSSRIIVEYTAMAIRVASSASWASPMRNRNRLCRRLRTPLRMVASQNCCKYALGAVRATGSALQRAETEHASVRLLAGFLLTMDRSGTLALSGNFRWVASRQRVHRCRLRSRLA